MLRGCVKLHTVLFTGSFAFIPHRLQSLNYHIPSEQSDELTVNVICDNVLLSDMNHDLALELPLQSFPTCEAASPELHGRGGVGKDRWGVGPGGGG